MYNEALSDYIKAIELEPNFHKAFFNRGTLFLKMEKSAEALYDFNKAIDLNPAYTEAYVNRGLLFMKIGRASCRERLLVWVVQVT